MAILGDLLFGTPTPTQAPASPRAASSSMSQQQLALGRQIYDFFVQQGLQPHQAAAIAGSMVWEGGGRTDLVNPGDNVRNSPNAPHSIGIAQWNDRSPALIAFARSQGIEIPAGDLRDANYARDVIRRIPLQTQLQFAWGEMQGPEGRAFRGISGAPDLRAATEGAIGYHRPAGFTWSNPSGGHGFDNRLGYANAILGANGQPSVAAAPPVAAGPQTPPAGTASAPAAAASPAPSTGQRSGGLLSGMFEGTPVEGIVNAFTPSAPQAPGALDPATQARSAALSLTPDTEMQLGGVGRPQLDLTRLRAILQSRGVLGTSTGA